MKSAFTFITAALVFIMAASSANAQTTKELGLERLGTGDLPVIHVQKGFSTLIEFPADQKIVEVTCGDKELFVVEGGGHFLHVKPAKEGVVTNLNVVMQGDIVYAFVLRETGGATERADLHVTVKPTDDRTKVSKSLTSVVKENDQPQSPPTESRQASAELNEKSQAPREKNEGHEQSAKETAPH